MTALVAIADYGVRDHKTKRIVEPCLVRRLVVFDGEYCSTECPHHVPTQGCDGFCFSHTEFAPNGGAFRTSECRAADPNTQHRAERALRMLALLKSRKRVRHSVTNEGVFIERIRARQRKRGGLTFEAIYALSGRPSKRIPWWQFEIYVFDLVRCGRLRVSNGHFFVDDNSFLGDAISSDRNKKIEPPDPRQLKIFGVE